MLFALSLIVATTAIATAAINAFNPDNGHWIYYYDSGTIEHMGTFIDGKQDGVWRSYYECGTLKAEIVYTMGNPGLWKYFDIDGSIIYEKNEL